MKINIGTKKTAPFLSVINTLFLLAIALSVLPYSYADDQDKGEFLKTVVLDPEASCISLSCHEGMGKKKFVHSIEVDGNKCDTCHEIVKAGEHNFRKMPQVTEPLCSKCHAEELAAPEEQAKESSEKTSSSLEDIMERMLEEEANKPEEKAPEPEEESPEPAEPKREPPSVTSKRVGMILHLPFAEGKCTECHEIHESNAQKYLKAAYPYETYSSYSSGTYNLCLKCHKELERVLTEPRTFTGTRFRNGNFNLHFRHINKKKGRACRNCHHHHGSKQSRLIRENFSFGKQMLNIVYKQTETGGNCDTACHMTVSYDRYEPVNNPMKTTPRVGSDATVEELKMSKEKDMMEDREMPETNNNDKGEER